MIFTKFKSGIIFNEDCIGKNGMCKIPDKSVDMILADLPYGTTACKWDSIIPLDKLWEQYKRIIKDNGAILLFGNEPFSSTLRLSNLPMFKYDWYWQKDKAANFLFGNKMPLKTIEVVSVFYYAQPTYNPQKEINPKGMSKRHLSPNPSKISKNVKEVMGDSWKETVMDNTQNYHGKNYEPDKLLPKQLVYFSREQRGKIHPTQKPAALFEYLIKTYTNENDLVLDNTAGSGTTGIACLNTNRRFILYEWNDKDNEYYKPAVERIKKREEELLNEQR